MSDILFFSFVSDEAVKRERLKAKELRKSRWWQEKCASGICHYCWELASLGRSKDAGQL